MKSRALCHMFCFSFGISTINTQVEKCFLSALIILSVNAGAYFPIFFFEIVGGTGECHVTKYAPCLHCHRVFFSVMEDLNIPFQESSGDILTLDTKLIMGDEVVDAVYNGEKIGKEQYGRFVTERLNQEQNKAITDAIAKNKLHLFSSTNDQTKSKTREQM